jgi:hypothetical protein
MHPSIHPLILSTITIVIIIIIIIIIVIIHQPALPASCIITIVLGSEDGVRLIAVLIADINSFKSALC